MEHICPVTGKSFIVSDAEQALRRKLNLEGDPFFHPVFRFQQLGAFWQHWALHKRTCERTQNPIVSVYGEDCPFPVWHKDEWLQHADPPGAAFDPARPMFPQMQEVFFRSPIPHSAGTGNENCEYTDDWWFSKNCYLSHRGYECEDLRYCFRCVRTRDCQFCVFCFDCERSLDAVNCNACWRVLFSLNCWNCRESALLYDCRNCSHCFLCSNLRGKEYCFGNEQLTKEEYDRRMREWDFRSRETYERAKTLFDEMLTERAWHRALSVDQCESSTGNYLLECKDCVNCFFLTKGAEDCVNILSGSDGNKDCLDATSLFAETELVYYTSLPQDHCYDVRWCHNVVRCRSVEYSMHCLECEHCFGCCGLRGKKYCILNRQYDPGAYERPKAEIVAHMKRTGEYGHFFPGSFAAAPYEESLSGFYWPIDAAEARRLGFRTSETQHDRPADTLDAISVPDRSDEAQESITKIAFWDDAAKRLFQILASDIAFARELGAPLPSSHYMRRIQENFRRIPFDGSLRDIACGRCGRTAQTSWPLAYDGRILCESCYLSVIY